MRKVYALILSAVCVFGAKAQDCSEIFISEYVEGWSNNKAIEIYNPTNATVDLSQYFVTRYSNGSNSATEANSIQLTGTIAPYDVYVATLDKRDENGTGQEAPVWDSLQARTDGFYSPVYNTSNAFYWNGNDAVVLYKGTLTGNSTAAVSGTAVDIFGKIGENPGPDTGWSTGFPYNNGAGVVVTQDHSMIRKSTVLTGVTNPLISFFDPLDEWDSIPPVVEIGGQTYGNWFSLGEHTCDCLTSIEEENGVSFDVYPNPSNGTFTVNSPVAIADLEVITLDGKVVYIQANIAAGLSHQVSVSETGMFIVNITTNDGNVGRKRIIVKK